MKKSTFLKKAVVFLFLLTAGFAFSQTGIKVTYYNGTVQNFAIQDTGKLYFSGDDLMIVASSGASATTIPTTIIKKIVLDNSILGTSETVLDKNMIVYPNPGADFIRISASDKSKTMNVKIYSMNGQIMHEGKYKSEQDINVSKLEKGIYLVNVNGFTIKFIKK